MNVNVVPDVAVPAFLAGGGETGALLRAYDWGATPLGPPETWPQPLRTAVELMLGARHPVYIAWGAELTSLYNDGYLPIVGTKHPQGIGQPFAKLWAEIWDEFRPIVEATMSGDSQYFLDLPIALAGRPNLPVGYFTFSYTALRDEIGTISGFYCAATETTSEVLARRALKDQTERQRRLFEKAPGFIAVLTGPEHIFEFTNESYAQVSGRQDFLGRTVREMFPDLEGQGLFELLDRVYATGQRYVAEHIALTFQDAPGQPTRNLFLDFIYEPIRDEQGGITGVFVQGHDVTDAHKAQEALRQSATELQAVLDAVPAAIWIARDPAANRIDGNERAHALLRAPRGANMSVTPAEPAEAPRGFRILDRDGAVIAPENLPVQRAARGEPVRDFEEDIVFDDGQVITLVGNADPLLDADGRPRGSVASFVDITARKRAEAALRESEERLRLATDNADIGFWDVDVVNDVLTWPPRTKAMFGISANAPVSMADFYAGLHPEDRKATGAAYAAAADPARRELYDVEYRTIGKEDGVMRCVAAKGRGVFDATGRCLRVTGTAIDVTKRKRADEALRKSEARQRFRAELGDALRGLTTPSEIMVAVAERVGPYLGVDQANYYIIDGDQFVVTEEWRTPVSRGMLGSHVVAGFGASMPSRMEAGEVLRLGDTRDVEGAEAYAANGMTAVLSAPLRSGGRWAGGFHVHSTVPRAWTDDEAELVREVGEWAWAASERARAEADLRESEERYRTLFENVDAGFCVAEVDFDAPGGRIDYRIVEANPAFYRQTGFPEAILGEWLREGAPALEEHWYETYGRVARTGEPARFEQGSDVLGRWFDVFAFRVGEPQERRVAILFNDISARRNAEEQLRKLNDTLEQQVSERTAERDELWRLSEDMLARADYTGMMSAVSPAWTRVLGWSEAELLTRRYSSFMHPDDMGPTLTAITGMSETGRPTRFENRIMSMDGGYKPIEWTVAPEPDGLNFIAVGRDLSAVKQREAELGTAQDALRQAQKLEAIGQLTGGVAHDFNNLLMIVQAGLNMLERKDDKAHREMLVTRMREAVTRGANLTKQLLAFSRRQELAPEAIDFADQMNSMADLLDHSLGAHVQLDLDLAGDLAPVFVDPNALQLAILNLAVNARDAMPKGGKIQIRAENGRHDDRAGASVRISVIDSGEGMTPEVRARIFEPFFTTKEIGKGSGLGLAQVHGFAQQSGGHVEVQTAVGKGTTVTLVLPQSETRADPVLKPAVGFRAARATGEAGLILLVEDDDEVAALTEEMLEHLGWRVTRVSGAQAALGALANGREVDLMFSDVMMPGGMNGLELAHEARKRRPSLPIVLMSGYAENVRREAEAAGVPLLPKPFSLDTLAAVLEVARLH